MDGLPIDVIGVIFKNLDLSIVEMARLKTVCRKFNQALNSPKLASLWHGKYSRWWQDRMVNGEYRKRPMVREEEVVDREPWCILDCGVVC